MNFKHLKFNSIFYFAFLLTLTISNSCSKDDEDEKEFSIVGTWNIDKFTMWWENNSTGELIEGPDSELNGGTITFNENNTGTWNDRLEGENMNFAITWFIFGDKITIEVEEEFFSAEYSMSDKNLNSLKLSHQKLISGNTLEKREIYLRKLN